MTQSLPFPPPPARNTIALLALLAGIAALIFAPVVFGSLLGVVAAILGIIGLRKTHRRGLAIAGLVSGAASIGIAFFALFFWIGIFNAFSAQRTVHTQIAHTTSDLHNLETALMIFEVDTGRYPTTAEGLDAFLQAPPSLPPGQWGGPYIEKHPSDAWGHDYIYFCPGIKNPSGYDLFSPGPDGIPNTPDDILSY